MIAPGATLGIIGGGQLGRMIGLSARAMGYRVVVADADPDCPAAAVADRVVAARLDDPEGVAPLADYADVITYEWENISPEVVERLAASKPVYPDVNLLRISQNRILEKTSLEMAGLPVAPWRPVNSAAELEAALAAIGLPAVLKTATEGYDGKGQAVLRSPEDAREAFARLGGRPLILEGFVPFDCELSVVVARNRRGEVEPFPVAENIHELNILAYSIVPARVPPSTAAEAQELAIRIATELDLVGLLGVEMFALPDGRLLINELAPRPHNSGHYTMDACVTSQFEQCVRAVCDLPLGAVDLLSPICMVNIMGEDYPLRVEEALANRRVKLHLYGKREAREHRKMGHMNVLASSADEALEAARQAKELIRGKPQESEP